MPPRTFTLPALLLALLSAGPAHAKNQVWWDCFFREFELCSGRHDDPDAPAPGTGEKGQPDSQKSYCDGVAHQNCDEEEAHNALKLSGPGGNVKISAGAGKASTIQLAPEEAQQGSPAAADDAVVEGSAASGDHTVLGVDVTMPISQAADAYRARNVRSCKDIQDSFARTLCLDAPGGASDSPVQLDYYRGSLASLSYETKGGRSVTFRAAVAVAEEKTGGKAALSPGNGSREPASYTAPRVCRARFAIGGGTLTLYGKSTESFGNACSPSLIDTVSLTKVEWAPGSARRREIEAQRKADHPGPPPKNEEIEKTRQVLPL